jgi:amino acid adenylation domain-containing protein
MRSTVPGEGIHGDDKRSSLLEKRQALARALLGKSSPAANHNGIKPRGQDSPAFLSFAQERLWFLDQWNSASSFYNVPIAVRLIGDLDAPALQKSLAAIVERHEVLRSAFPAVDGRPVQSVRPVDEIALPLTDLSGLSAKVREQEAGRIALEEASRPFDLSIGPLVRTSLLKLGTQEHILLLTLHHIATDGWSRGVLMRELGALYSAFAKGEPNPLPKLPIQYSDYAAWQRATLQGEALEREIAYWRPQLAGAPALLDLPADRPRPAAQSFCGARLRQRFPLALADSLNALSGEANVTFFMTLLGAFAVLLYRYTGQDDLVVGTPIANRTRTEIEGLIGFFSNTLALRVRMGGDPSFREVLSRVRETALGAYGHQDLPFEKLVEELQPERSLSHAPLFQVMFMLTNPYGISPELPGLKIEPIEVDRSIAKMDLLMGVERQEGALLVTIEYNTDLFDTDRMERLLGHYGTLLEGIVANPDERISAIALLTEAERYQILFDWNDTQVDYLRELCIHDLFEAQARATPDAIALEYGPDRLTYRELDEEANKLAHYLRERGVGLDVPVGLCMERSLQMLIGMLAILKAGGAYVPIDPQYPADRISFQLQDAKAALVLTQGDPISGLAESGVPVVRVDDLGPLPERKEAPKGSSHPAAGAYVIYTSGSTGRPKGVVMTHSALANLLHWQLGQTPEPARTLQFTSIGFDVSFQEIFSTWLCGGTLILVNEEVRRDPPALLRVIDEARIERLFMPFAVLQHLALAADAPVRSLRQVITAGEQLQKTEELTAFLERMPGVTLSNQYGPTEAHVVTAYLMEGSPADWPLSPPIGKPIGNDTIYILDARMQPAPVGVAGELYIGGTGVARGYLNRPDMTAEKFVPDPFSAFPGARLYRTCDLCRYLSDGNIEFLGRIDHQVKVRGFRIELGEIESVLMAHPDVKEAVVLARQDNPGEKRLVAYLSAVGNVAINNSALREYLRGKLPDYMVPSAFVAVDHLSLNSNGKVDRKALPAPDTDLFSEGFVGPRNAIEESLAQVWSELLHVDGIGVHSNFFELGGHSLLATRVTSRIRSAFGVELPISALFESPTIAGLADRISASLRAVSGPVLLPAPPLARGERGGPLPLSFSQQRLWFLDQYEPGSPQYNISSALRLSGELNQEALKRSLTEIVRRHEVLRTIFTVIQDEPAQIVQEPYTVSIAVTDLAVLPADAREKEARRLAYEEAQKPFDLSTGPLLRASLLKISESDHVLLLSVHHIVSDGWSMGVLTREMTALYNAFVAGAPSPLAELPIQFGDYAAWQREWLSGDVLSAQLSHWKDHLAGAPALLELPTDRPRPAAQTYHGDRKRVLLPAGLTQSLKALGRQENATLFMTLLAAFNVLLFRYCRQEEIVVGTAIANRTRSETEGLIGCFFNSLAIHTSLSESPTFNELLARVRQATLSAYVHQDLPFEKVVDELAPERSLSYSPIYQVMFILQNTPGETLALKGLQAEPLGDESVNLKIDLQLTAMQRGEELLLSLVYNTDLFDSDRMERLLSHFETLLQGIVSNPTENVGRLPMLTQAERTQLLVEWNSAPGNHKPSRTIHDVFAERAAQTPDATAVVYEDQSLSYKELDERSNQLAHSLRRQGVGPETLVGLCVERSLDLVIGLLGILKAGGAYVPLDPAYPEERLAFMLESSNASILLTQEPLRGKLEGHGARIVRLDDSSIFTNESAEAPACDTTPDNLAYAIFTSGSTGRPKGVQICHGQVVGMIEELHSRVGTDSNDSWTVFHSYAFDFSVWELWSPLLSGGKLVVVPKETTHSPEALHELLCNQKVTIVNLTPSVLGALLRFQKEAAGSLPALSLRAIHCGGEALPRDVAEEVLELGLPVWNFYGPTESTVWATLSRVAKDGLDQPVVGIGQPFGGRQVYILSDNLEPLPVGVPGELYIGGAGLARGYTARAELTAERFVPDPFSGLAGARLYKTGDLCRYMADGTIEYIGRSDHQVKIRGFRIELGEIESVLLDHGSVREAVVVVREDKAGDKQLVAYVVGREGDPEPDVLREHLKKRLPEYMAPSVFVSLPALPLSPNGKVDRKALPAPEYDAQNDEFVPPRTPVEECLAEIWALVLGRDRVGVMANFFELGGHSLLAAQVVSRIRSTFDVNLPLRILFEAPTISGLAKRVLEAQGMDESDAPLVPVDRDGALPLSFAQHRLWFMDRLHPGSSLFNVPLAMRVRGPLNIEALQAALDKIQGRHEVLRTVFEDRNGEPVQIITAGQPREVGFEDMSGMAVNELVPALDCAIAREAGHPFDLARGPVYRCHVVRLAPDEHIVVLCLHHIACDVASLPILFDELSMTYREAVAGIPAKLADLPVQYADYAVWQRERFAAGLFERQIAYWKKTLLDAPAVEIPTDFPRPESSNFARGSVRLSISGKTVEAVNALCRQESATTFMFLLAVFQLLLAKETGQKDIVVGADAINRDHPQIRPLIGFFVNQLVFRTDLTDCATPRELLRCVRNVALGAYANQELPFDKLVEALRPSRGAQQAPFFQAKLAYARGGAQQAELEGLSVERIPSDRGTAQLDLTFFLREHAGEIFGQLEYRADLFKHETVARLVAEYERMIRSCAEEPDGPLSLDAQAKAPQAQERLQANRQKLLGSLKLSNKNASRTPD